MDGLQPEVGQHDRSRRSSAAETMGCGWWSGRGPGSAAASAAVAVTCFRVRIRSGKGSRGPSLKRPGAAHAARSQARPCKASPAPSSPAALIAVRTVVSALRRTLVVFDRAAFLRPPNRNAIAIRVRGCPRTATRGVRQKSNDHGSRLRAERAPRRGHPPRFRFARVDSRWLPSSWKISSFADWSCSRSETPPTSQSALAPSAAQLRHEDSGRGSPDEEKEFVSRLEGRNERRCSYGLRSTPSGPRHKRAS